MINLLEHNRRPDITFNRNGTITIAARLARILSLRPGYTVNIAIKDHEYLLHAVSHQNGYRYEAQCYRSNKGGENYRANSVKLCRSLLNDVGIKSDRASFMTGDAFEWCGAMYVPIITKHPL